MEPRSDYSTSSASINIMADLPPVPDLDWSIHDEYDYIGNIDALDIHIVYMDEINKVASNPRDSWHYYTSKTCAVCGNTVQTFD